MARTWETGGDTARVYDLRRLDLNLVVPLHALLVERSVSAAARRVDLTQPAVSKSLQKLRNHFSDDLLVRNGRSSSLTPFAATLLPDVEDLVRQLSDVLTPRGTFDPATTRRRFIIGASDYFSVVLGDEVARAMRREAPGASLDLVGLGIVAPYEQLTSVDALILPPGQDARLQNAMHLYTEQWALVVDPSLADQARHWTKQDLAHRTFVATAVGAVVPARTLLGQLGIEIDVRITTPTFSAVPFLIRGTEHVGLAGRRLAERLAGAAGVAVIEPQWTMPLLPLQVYSDAARARDGGTRWFLELLGRAAASVLRPDDSQ